jgi:hypothetical protein
MWNKILTLWGVFVVAGAVYITYVGAWIDFMKWLSSL